MHWYEISASRGVYGWGDGAIYLVSVLDHEVRLSRYRYPAASPLDMAVEAVCSTIVFPLGRGPGRPGGEPELAALVKFAKDFAEQYEGGGDFEEYPAWRHEPTAARRHFHEPFEVERECRELHVPPGEDPLADLRAEDGHVPDYNRAEAERRLAVQRAGFLATGDANDCPSC